MSFHHASTYAGHAATQHFLGNIGHSIFNAMLYSTIYRMVRHVPLPIMILLIAVIVVIGYQRARNTGRGPW